LVACILLSKLAGGSTGELWAAGALSNSNTASKPISTKKNSLENFSSTASSYKRLHTPYLLKNLSHTHEHKTRKECENG